MNTFEITIQHQPRGQDYYPVVVEYSRPDNLLPIRVEGKLEFDQETERDLKRLTLKPQKYGQRLGELLFDRKLDRAFGQAQADDGLRVMLAVEAPELRGLHWERLTVPGDDDRLIVLARSQNYPFSVSLASSVGKQFPPIGQHDLRALIVAARPVDIEEQGLAAFDDQAAIKATQAALGGIPSDVLAAGPAAKGLPTLDNLRAALTDQNYPLLHLIAHGQYDKRTRESYVFLANAQNKTESVSATELIEYLIELRNIPRFAFLVTCESADPQAEVEDSLGGLGQRLVRELGLHAVVAMTDKVTIATATALAPTFYERLREHGQPDRALVEAGAGLTQRRDLRDFIVPVLFSRLRGRPLYSDAADRPPTDSEIKVSLARLPALLEERAPTLLEPFTDHRRRLEQSLGGTTKEVVQERDEALRHIDEICYEVLDFSFADLARGQAPPPYHKICPFPGLKAFGVPDDQESHDTRQFFFGRDALVTELAQLIEQNNFLAVLGASGSGKSSLVMAGLVPAWQQQHPGWQVVYLKPGPTPSQTLHTALAPFKNDNSQSTIHNSQLIIVIDQFEELFTLANDEERQTFLDELLALISPPNPPEGGTRSSPPFGGPGGPAPKLILTMRADFIGDCALYDELKRLLEQHTKLISPMKPAELRQAISQQAETAHLRFDPDLINTIMADVETEPGAMPLLQHAMRQLWEHRHGRWLRASTYRELGGIQEAIGHTATELYNTLTATEQELARDIFLRLTRPDPETHQGKKYRDTRRRVLFGKLVPIGQDEAEVESLVEKLATARLLVTSVNETAKEKEVEMAHEALIRYWPLLTHWVDEDREKLRLRINVEIAAEEWERNGRDAGYLWPGSRLSEVENQLSDADFNTLMSEFVQACQEVREADRRASYRRTLIWIGTGSLILVLLVVIGLIYYQNRSPWNRTFADDQVWSLTATNQTPPTYYLGTKDSGFRRSTDGITWTTLQAGLPKGIGEPGRDIPAIERIAIDGQDPNRLFAFVSRHGVYRSFDAGDTWALAGTGVLTTSDIIDLAVWGDLVLAVSDAMDGRGLYVSQNDGQDWSLIGGKGNTFFDKVYTVHIDSRGDYTYVGAATGFYRLPAREPISGTSAWQEIDDLPPVTSIESAKGRDEIFYLATFNPRGIGSIYRWQPGQPMTEHLIDVEEQPKVLMPHPDQTGSVLIYILFANNRVFALQRTGEQVWLGREPSGIAVALLADLHPTEHRLWLLLGHEEGLYEYIDELD